MAKGNNSYQIDAEKFLNRKERKQLLKTTKEKADLDLMYGRRSWVVRFMLIDLAMYSGLRVAELADLKIGDLTLSGSTPNLVVRRGKGDKKRTVYIDKELVKHLKDFIALKRTTFNEETNDESPLFAGRNGNHVQPITLMKSFKVAIENADLPEHYSIHSARHTYATYLLQDCKNLKYVQKQLGHSNISMTALYSDIAHEESAKLADMITRD